MPQTGSNDIAGQIANSQTNVDFTGSPAPTSGQIPIATSGTSATWSDPPWANARDPPEAFTTQQRISLFTVDWTESPSANAVTITTASGGSYGNVNGILNLNSSSNATSSVEAVGGALLDKAYRELYVVTDARLNAIPTHSGTRVWLIQVGDTQNGLRYGYIGPTRTIAVYNVGVETLIQTFNGDPLNGTTGSVFRRNGAPEALIPLNLNLFRIRFLDLAGGLAKFDVLSPDGDWVTFHSISKVNATDAPLTSAPSFKVGMSIVKASSDSQLILVSTTHWDAGIYGNYDPAAGSGPTTITGAVKITDDGVDIAPVSPTLGLAVEPKALPPNAAKETGGNLELIRGKTDQLFIGTDGLYIDNRTLPPNAAKELGGNLELIRAQTDLLAFYGDRLKVDVIFEPNDDQIGAVEIKDGNTDERATVLAPSTPTSTGDTTLVVGLHPNSPLPAGTNTLGKVDQGVQGSSGSPWFTDPVDRAGRLLGIVYGDQGQLAQRSGTKDAYVQLRTAGTEYDARQTRALTTADQATVFQGTTPWQTNVQQWLGSTAPTVGQKTMAESVPVTIASDQPVLGIAVIEAIETNNYDLQASPYNTASNLTTDYILDHIVVTFTSALSRDITITSANGDIIFRALGDTSLRLELENVDEAYKANENFTIYITQTAGACLVDVTATVKGGTAILSGPSAVSNPTQDNAFATLSKAIPDSTSKELRFDDISAGDLYIGRNGDGTATSSATWEVVRYYRTATGAVTRARYRMNVAWDSRTAGWT